MNRAARKAYRRGLVRKAGSHIIEKRGAVAGPGITYLWFYHGVRIPRSMRHFIDPGFIPCPELERFPSLAERFGRR